MCGEAGAGGLERKVDRKGFDPAGKRWQFLGLFGLQVVMRRPASGELGLLRGSEALDRDLGCSLGITQLENQLAV